MDGSDLEPRADLSGRERLVSLLDEARNAPLEDPDGYVVISLEARDALVELADAAQACIEWLDTYGEPMTLDVRAALERLRG